MIVILRRAMPDEGSRFFALLRMTVTFRRRSRILRAANRTDDSYSVDSRRKSVRSGAGVHSADGNGRVL